MGGKYLFIAFLFAAGAACAQQEKVVIRFVDEVSGTPLKKVRLIDMAGRELAQSDTEGYAILPLLQSPIVALSPGYRPDTLSGGTTIAHMRPLTVAMDEAVVSATGVYRLLDELNEYVVDYDILGTNILVATYSGNNGGNAKLFLASKSGSIISRLLLLDEPIALYRSCVGVHYCVFGDRFCPVEIRGKEIRLGEPRDISWLPALRQCELATDSSLYYKLADRRNFRTCYGMTRKGTSAFKPFASFAEDDVAQASYEEWLVIQALLGNAGAPGRQSEAARRQLNRLKWDRGSFAHINMPLVKRNDTLAVFDFFKKKLLLYSAAGDTIGTVPVNFPWRQSQQFTVLIDEVTSKVYLHRYDQQQVHNIEELNIATGAILPGAVRVARPFAENVKVYNGDIYFLWQDNGRASTRQLFIQKRELPVSAK